MTPSARVLHRSKGRLRLQIPSARGLAPYFDDLSRRLSLTPGVESVKTNARTASVLILHGASFDLELLSRYGREHRLFDLSSVEPRPAPALSVATGSLRELDGRLSQASQGQVDLRSLTVLVLLLLAVVQGLRGRLLGPASTLLWYAFGLIKSMPAPAPPAKLDEGLG